MIKSSLKRVLQYRICLTKFKGLGFARIYSYNLGKEAGVSPEQVRKDFSNFGITGNKRAGYEIDTLLDVLNKLFGNEETQNVIIVGLGNMGKALANYNKGFIGHDVFIVAGFDIDPSKQNKKIGLPIYGMEKLSEIIKKHKVNTAIISAPSIASQEICNKLVANGIIGILNFAPIVLKAPKNVVIENINLSTEIEAIVYILNQKNL